LTSETAIGYTTSYGYNSADLMTSMTYPDGEAVTNGYNSRMLLDGASNQKQLPQANNFAQADSLVPAGVPPHPPLSQRERGKPSRQKTVINGVREFTLQLTHERETK